MVIPAKIQQTLKLLRLSDYRRHWGGDDGSIPGIHPLETDMDAFRTVINYRRYRLTNRAAHIDPYADFSLHKLKRLLEDADR